MKYATPIRIGIGLSGLALGLMAAAAALPADNYRHPLCPEQTSAGSKSAKSCVTVEVEFIYWIPDAEFDGIEGQINSSSCAVALTDGSTKQVEGYLRCRLDGGTAPVSRRWVIPAGCPFQVRAHNVDDDIVDSLRFSGAQTQNDISATLEFELPLPTLIHPIQ